MKIYIGYLGLMLFGIGQAIMTIHYLDGLVFAAIGSCLNCYALSALKRKQ